MECKEFVKIKQFAEMFGVSDATVKNWIIRGEVVAIKIGKFYYVDVPATIALLREREKQKQEIIKNIMGSLNV
ncbi:MAG: helix-turn-helix domain-containing protein [Thermoplasmata archaeon]